jgi:hypothetical protein
MVVAPPPGAIFAQELLVDFADLFQSPPHPVEVLQLLADLGDLGGMESDLTVLRARVVYVENPLEVAFAAGTGGAGDRRGMKGVAFEERATKDRIERRKSSQELAGYGCRLWLLFTSHLYRCYTFPCDLSIHLCKNCRGKVRNSYLGKVESSS